MHWFELFKLLTQSVQSIFVFLHNIYTDVMRTALIAVTNKHHKSMSKLNPHKDKKLKKKQTKNPILSHVLIWFHRHNWSIVCFVCTEKFIDQHWFFLFRAWNYSKIEQTMPNINMHISIEQSKTWCLFWSWYLHWILYRNFKIEKGRTSL